MNNLSRQTKLNSFYDERKNKINFVSMLNTAILEGVIVSLVTCLILDKDFNLDQQTTVLTCFFNLSLMT